MTAGPYGPPPEDTPPSSGPPPGETPPGGHPPAETPPAETPRAETPPAERPPAEYAPPAGYAPPEGSTPSYYPPPEAAMAPPPRRRSLGPIIAIILVVVVVLAALGAYLVAGVAFAQNRLSTAHNAYNSVVGHQNELNGTINSLSDKITGTDVSSVSGSTLQTDKEALVQIVTKSQAAQGQIDSDDASLAKADAGLKENQWLTLLRKSDIDKESTRIGHARKALGV